MSNSEQREVRKVVNTARTAPHYAAARAGSDAAVLQQAVFPRVDGRDERERPARRNDSGRLAA